MRTVKKKGGGKLGRSEIVQVRFDPQLRFAADLAARAQKRTLSSYIESTVFKDIQTIQVDFLVDDSFLSSRNSSNPVMLSELIKKLWHPDEILRFINIAEHAPLLLSKEESLRWHFITKQRSYWHEPSDSEPQKLFMKFLRAMWDHLVEMSDEDDYDWDLHAETLTSITERAPDSVKRAFKKAVKDLRTYYDED
jgi:hypothetical protein